MSDFSNPVTLTQAMNDISERMNGLIKVLTQMKEWMELQGKVNADLNAENKALKVRISDLVYRIEALEDRPQPK